MIPLMSFTVSSQVISPALKVLGSKNTKISNPFDLRDPFKRNLPRRSRLKKSGKTKYFNGSVFTNVETVQGVPIEEIRVVGVLLGPNRRALVKIVSVESSGHIQSESEKASAARFGQRKLNDSPTYVVKEGMKLGLDGAVVKAILPGGIVLVEKIRNVYDQDEYLETIIPVSE